jgi:hypothetical protein
MRAALPPAHRPPSAVPILQICILPPAIFGFLHAFRPSPVAPRASFGRFFAQNSKPAKTPLRPERGPCPTLYRSIDGSPSRAHPSFHFLMQIPPFSPGRRPGEGRFPHAAATPAPADAPRTRHPRSDALPPGKTRGLPEGGFGRPAYFLGSPKNPAPAAITAHHPTTYKLNYKHDPLMHISHFGHRRQKHATKLRPAVARHNLRPTNVLPPQSVRTPYVLDTRQDAVACA